MRHPIHFRNKQQKEMSEWKRGEGKRSFPRLTALPLSYKFMLVVVLISILFASVGSAMIVYMESSYTRMLYDAISDSLSYSGSEISNYLGQMENLTMMFLSDENVQSDLRDLTSAEEDAMKSRAVTKVRGDISAYYHNASDGILRYISLHSGDTLISSNIIRAGEIPGEVQKMILDNADQEDGGVSWTSQYMEDYGLFLSRNINDVNSVFLNKMATIVLCVDMEKLVQKATSFHSKYGNAEYIITENDALLFHTQGIDEEKAASLLKANISGYAQQKLDGIPYLIVHGTIPDYDYSYYCLVSFLSVQERIIRIREIGMILLAAIIGISICVQNRFSKDFMGHVNRLVGKMGQFAEDNTTMPKGRDEDSLRTDEIGVLNRQFDQMCARTILLIQQNYVNELLKKDARLKLLEHQINPHFLYNTLASLAWRAEAAGQTEISEMVDALSKLLRVSLSQKSENFYSLQDEIAIVNAYVKIQQLRYEDRLLYRDFVDAKFYDHRILKLSIEPLIENAIAYGLEENVGDCEIILRAESNRHIFKITVSNSGSEFEDHLLEKLKSGEIQPHGNGIGLLNIDQRIKLQYGEQYGLRLYNTDDYAVAEMNFPGDEKDDAENDPC